MFRGGEWERSRGSCVKLFRQRHGEDQSRILHPAKSNGSPSMTTVAAPTPHCSRRHYTTFHIAAYQSYDLLRELLDLSQLSLMPLTAPKSYGIDKEVREGGGEITMQNVFGNTPLHDAAAAGCLDAVELLCRTCPYLTKM
ncbi:hypothetical protein Ancab_019870 [Ancistrocladus abbreviatus]